MPITEKPAFPIRVYWTWDHSTNWEQNSSWQLDWGTGSNVYLKSPETFINDYRMLIDHCVKNGANGIIIWGFIRHDHGGIETAKETCRYARERGIRILPGVGTGAYGGFFFSGEHEFNAETFLSRYPEVRGVREQSESNWAMPGQDPLEDFFICPTHPATKKWLREGTQWLYETFAISGLNLEQGDYLVCYCDRCRKERDVTGSIEHDYYKDMATAHRIVAEQALKCDPETWVLYATYTGFAPWDFSEERKAKENIRPSFADIMPANAICQWTISGMVNQQPVPLVEWLDDGAPWESARTQSRTLANSPGWPRNLKPPTLRNAGFLHQGSQWCGLQGKHGHSRHSLSISAIKEACLRGQESGLEGIIIHGEVSSRCVPYALNYLAHIHFSYNPEDNLRNFAKYRMAPILGGEEKAVRFVELLASVESGSMTAKELSDLSLIVKDTSMNGRLGKISWDEYRFWRWLGAYTMSRTGIQVMPPPQAYGYPQEPYLWIP